MNSTVKNNVYDKLIDERIIFINGEINVSTASDIVANLLYLDFISNEDITIYINSPGGHVTDGLMIYDTIKYLKSDVSTIGIGLSASMAGVLLASGTKGKRKILPHGKVMLHEVSAGTDGKLTNILLATKEAKKTNDILLDIIAQNSNFKKTELKQKLTTDFYMDCNEAIKYGIVDKIIC